MIFNHLKIVIVSIFLLISIAESATGDWQAMTYMDEVNCLQVHNEHVYVGTTGGIRKHQPITFKEKIYNNPYDGFLDVDVVAMTVTEKNELWAATKNGYLYKLEKSGQWSTIDRGFNKMGWKFNKKAILSVGPYIILGANKGLSFLNISKPGEEFTEINLNKFSDKNNLSITALFKSDSVLYIGTTSGLYKAVLYWENITNPPASFSRIHDKNIFNPNIWEKSDIVKTTNSDLTETVGHIRLYNKEIQTFSSGHTVYKPYFCSAIPGRPLQIGNEFLDSITNMESVVKIKKNVFMGNSTGFFTLQADTAQQFLNLKALPKGVITNIYPHSTGLYAWTLLKDDEVDNNIYDTYIMRYNHHWYPIAYTYKSGIEPSKHHMGTFSVFGPNNFMLGTWGFGIYAQKDDPLQFLNTDNSCMTGFWEGSAYAIVRSTVAVRSGGIIAALYHDAKPFSLLYANFDNTLNQGTDSLRAWCFGPNPNLDEKANLPYQLKIINNDVLLVSSNLGVYSFRINNLKSTSGLSFIKKTISPDNNLEIRAAEIDNYGRLWATGPAGFYYLDDFLNSEDSELIRVDEINEIECNNLEKDSFGNLWAGCKTGLLYIQPERKTHIGKISHYKNRDGMLDDEVVNLHINQLNGEIWIVTPKGINIFESGIAPGSKNSKSIEVFPNPFKPEEDYHISLVNLPESAEVYIFNESGTLIFRSTSVDLKFGEVKWTGTNLKGKKVASGIYFYAVKSENDVSKGKIILAR